MYFPYLRGKTFELIALREVAAKLNPNKVIPIIEPVKEKTKPLVTTILALNTEGIRPHIVVNPEVGDLTNTSVQSVYTGLDSPEVSFVPCIRVNNQNLASVLPFLQQLKNDGIDFSLFIQEPVDNTIAPFLTISVANIIKDLNSYPSTYANSIPKSVVLTASFPWKVRNADYIDTPVFFSDAHITYKKPLISGQIGFGDYLMVHDGWTTGGGPAYVVTLHLTYILNQDRYMYVRHCKSVSDSDNQSNAPKKFQEALSTLIQFANNEPSVDRTTLGYKGLLALHGKPFPQLAVPKKFSMMHHLETVSNYI
ncbi:sce7725 family protein [Vibrio cyclitrophicus]|uniref:sce7725 family protein n=1 Tax=Vibrio TaxID=662 RepID=UPI00031F65A2|nr:MULTISPECIES: sce7725 family protein [Vibrio]OEF42224.1 ATP-binding protein [Vibrio cyclitrophicus 1F289]OMO23115.1 ATP-binding protein [Vibrio lentus]